MMAQKSGRAVVRDPRKRTSQNHLAIAHSQQQNSKDYLAPQEYSPPNKAPMSFIQSNPQDQQSLGSSMVSYALAGVGMTLGFVLVGSIVGL